MPIYETIPRQVSAEQWNGVDICRGVCFCQTDTAHVHTTHDNQICFIEKGDYIIPEPNGVNYYPCKADIFEARHRSVSIF